MKKEIDVEKYKERILEEYELIKRKNFTKYFVIVADLIQWAKENEIMVGPGRGSVTGSIIAFLLGITDIDSIEHKTSFTRFLNEGRSHLNPPDIDVDFSDDKRGLIGSRLRSLYGENNVAGVSTFLQIRDKQALKDVAKAFDVPFQEVNNFSKTIVDSLEEALETEQGMEFQAKYPDVVRHALKLNGNFKAYGQHPAAQIISDEDLTLGTRVNLAERNGHTVISADMEDAEYLGLLKLDVLGLSNLTIISHCLKLIKKNYNKNIDLVNLNLNDKNIFKELSQGNCVGVFQFGTWAMSRLSREMGIDCFSDMVAALACVRPGPMNSGITDRFIKNKKSGDWSKKNPVYEDITKETYGELIFQEQILEVFIKIAGLTPEVAEKIRKIIGKKRDQKYFAEHKNTFIEGCKNVGYFTEEESENFWSDLLNFAEYAFSKNHSVAYSKIAYDCAWLKYYFPECFLVAALTHGGEAEKPKTLNELLRLNIEIVPPKMEASHITDWVVSGKRAFIPFTEIKGIGPAALETIKQYQESLNQSNGFFKKDTPVIKGKLKTILEGVGAFTEEVPETIDSYFQNLGVTLNPKVKYRKLFALVENAEQYNINDLLTGNFKGHMGREITDKTMPLKNLISCSECELRHGCNKPALPTVGNFNIAIINEQPHWNDEKTNKYLIKEFKKYNFEKEDFLLTNLVKCESRSKPTKQNIQTCGDKWLTNELKNVRFALCFGNSAISYFKSEDSGIMKYNGQVEWVEEISTWVCYCISPSMVLWKPEEFKPKFREGIKSFINLLEGCGGYV